MIIYHTSNLYGQDIDPAPNVNIYLYDRLFIILICGGGGVRFFDFFCP